MAANYKQYWNILDRFDRFMTQQNELLTVDSYLMIEIDRDLFTFFKRLTHGHIRQAQGTHAGHGIWMRMAQDATPTLQALL
jgi:hypothetical protein